MVEVDQILSAGETGLTKGLGTYNDDYDVNGYEYGIWIWIGREIEHGRRLPWQETYKDWIGCTELPSL